MNASFISENLPSEKLIVDLLSCELVELNHNERLLLMTPLCFFSNKSPIFNQFPRSILHLTALSQATSIPLKANHFLYQKMQNLSAIAQKR